MADSDLSQVFVLCRRWFPGREIDVDCMAEAIFTERDYWQKMTTAVCNGIAKAFKG